MSRIIPILLLIAFGFALRRLSFFTVEAKAGIDKIIVRISLPAMLFLSFMDLDLKVEDIPMAAAVFLFCVALFLAGKALVFFSLSKERLLPYLMTSLSFGLMGLTLFQGVFGFENLGVFAKLGLGHELFFWFFLLTALDTDFGKRKPFKVLIGEFIRSPVILAILGGIALGLLDAGPLVEREPVLSGIRAAIRSVAELAAPLVMISVGYGLRFERAQMKLSVIYVSIRLAAVLLFGTLIKRFIIDRFVAPEPLLDHAFFLVTILPPVFSLPLFTKPYVSAERNALANNVIVLYTMAMLAIFSVYVLVYC